MQGGLSQKRNARPSVKRVNCDKTKVTSAKILTPYKRSVHLVFPQEEWFVGNDALYLKFWVKLTLLERKRRFSIDIRSEHLSRTT